MKRILRRILFIGAALVLALDAWLYLPGFLSGPQELTGETEVHFIDVGQGDSILLLSGGQAVLVDAGTAESGDTIVRYLEELDVYKRQV